MRPYFETMPSFGKELKENRITRTQESRAKPEAVEAEIGALHKARQDVGVPAAEINKRGSLTVWQRIEYLVDKGTFLPLHSLYNPEDNEEGTTNVVDGLGKIGGRWAVIIGFDNKLLAGAWIPGQPENILRVTNIAKRLHIPLVWLVQCSGVKMTDQEKFYADRRGSGTCFYRHAELEQMGIPILAGIYGTNRACGVRRLAKSRPITPRLVSSRACLRTKPRFSTASRNTCGRLPLTTRCSSEWPSRRSRGLRPTTSTICCRPIRRRAMSSTKSSLAWSTAANTWSSAPIMGPRFTLAWSRSTAC